MRNLGASLDMFLQPPVKKYQTIDKIGQGANGEVFKEIRLEDNKIVAIKYLTYSDPKALSRFQNEINFYQQFNDCPYIVELLDYSLNPFRRYLVMEFCKYGNARNNINLFLNNYCLGTGLLLGIARGVQRIHSEGIYHRDIKPDNLLLTEDADGNYILKLGDAGVACLLPNIFGFSNATYSLQGTPNYVAPELYEGKPYTKAADIFSFGVTCHELFTQIRPFPGQKVTLGPTELGNLIERMIAVNPHHRPTIDQVISEMTTAYYQLQGKQNLFTLAGIVLGSIAIAIVGDKVIKELYRK